MPGQKSSPHIHAMAHHPVVGPFANHCTSEREDQFLQFVFWRKSLVQLLHICHAVKLVIMLTWIMRDSDWSIFIEAEKCLSMFSRNYLEREWNDALLHWNHIAECFEYRTKFSIVLIHTIVYYDKRCSSVGMVLMIYCLYERHEKEGILISLVQVYWRHPSST